MKNATALFPVPKATGFGCICSFYGGPCVAMTGQLPPKAKARQQLFLFPFFPQHIIQE
jgi:hypothetical protein